MEWYEAEVRGLEAALAERRDLRDLVVFYGSSSIRLWDTLAADLRNARALNLGFGGSTLEACVYFFDRLVRPVSPCSLVVYAGDNDLGDGRTPREVAHFFDALTEKVNQALNGIPMAFISIKPSPARWEIAGQIREANALIHDAIRKRPASYYIDVFSAMLDTTGRPRGELYMEDGLHLSPAGYKLWSELLYPYRHRMFTTDCPSIKEALKQSQATGRLRISQSPERERPV